MSLLALLPLFGGCIGTDLVEENAIVDPEIRIESTSVALLQDDTTQLQATYYDGLGNPDRFVSLVWTSANPAIASVDAAGRARANGPGQTTVMASYQDVVSSAILVTVVVDENSPASVRIEPNSVSLEAGESASISASVFNISGQPVQGVQLTWTSSDAAVASVAADGTVMALSPGEAGITAVVDGIASTPARVVVLGRTRQGTFQQKPGTSYNVSGSVELRELPGGRLQLTFGGDFLTSDGPDVDVYLSHTNQVTGASVSLGDLASTIGQQSYSVPSSIEFGEYNWVIIHCVAFNVSFGYASLR